VLGVWALWHPGPMARGFGVVKGIFWYDGVAGGRGLVRSALLEVSPEGG